MKNLVWQYFIGKKPPEYVSCSWDSFRRYAKRHNLEHITSTDQYIQEYDKDDENHKLAIRYFEILRLIYDPQFDAYDNILYVDSDVIAVPDAPNIFDIECKHVACWTERHSPGSIAGPGYRKGSDKYKQVEKAFREFNAPLIDSEMSGAPTRILNSGVIVFSKEARILARRTFDDWILWFDRIWYPKWITLDQLYIAAMFNKYKFDVKEIDDKWNVTLEWYPPNKCPKSYFYHFSNAGKKDIVPFYNQYFSRTDEE
jgi:hypothetical protein